MLTHVYVYLRSPGGCPNGCKFNAMCLLENREFRCSCDPIQCDGTYKPLCGKDGKTYSNDCERKLEECRTETDIPVKQQGPCGECGELFNVFLCVLVILCQRNRCCLISIVCLLVFGCVLWETLVEGAHSLSFPCRSHSAISSDDTWNADFMFHSCPHPSSASRPHQSFHVQMSRHFPLCPFMSFFGCLKTVFSVPVCLSVCLCLCDVCSGPPPDTPLVASGEEFNLWPFLLEFRPVGLLQGGPQRAGLMSFFLPVPFCLCLVCLFAWWRMLEWPSLQLQSSWHYLEGKWGHGALLFFECCVCLDESLPNHSDPVVALLPHGCMHVAPLIGAMLVSLLCLSIETESTQLRKHKNYVKMWKRAFPYLKCPGITLATENLC